MRTDQLGLGAGFPRCLDRLNALQGTSLADALHELLLPTTLLGVAGKPPLLATLPLTAQASLLLLLKSAPHRFTSTQHAALLTALSELSLSNTSNVDTAQPSLLELLAADVRGSGSCMAADTLTPPLPPVPACPFFLYTPQPCFPWAPVLADAATAAAWHGQQQQQQQQEEAWAAAGEEQQPKQRPGEHEGSGTKRAAQQAPDGAGGSTAKRQHAAANSKHPPPASAPTGRTAAMEDEISSAVQAVRSTLQHSRTTAASAAAAAPSPTTLITPPLQAALNILLAHAAASGPAGTAALQEAGLSSLQSDALLLLLLSELVTPASSFARSSAAAAGLLLPRLKALEGPASRDLAAALEHIGSCNPQACTVACLQPLLSSPALNKHQADLLGSTLKTSLPHQLLPDVVAAACGAVAPVAAAAATGAAAAAPGSAWNEHTVAVLQAVLTAKPLLGASHVAQLAIALHGASSAPAGAAELAATVKFAKLVLSLVKQYPQQIQAAGCQQQLQAVAQACRSFMAKSLQAAVAKL